MIRYVENSAVLYTKDIATPVLHGRLESVVYFQPSTISSLSVKETFTCRRHGHLATDLFLRQI